MFCLRFQPAALLAFLAALAVPSMSQTDLALSRFIQPNAKALISVDWKHIRQSDIGAKFRDQSFPPAGRINTAIPGIEILNDVDRILISTSGRQPGDAADAQPLVLIALTGHFDPTKVRSILTKYGAKPQMFNSIQVFRPQSQDGKDMAIVPLDAQTVLLGDAASVFASLERTPFSSPAPDANSLVARSSEMDSKYDIWVIASKLDALSGKDLNGTFGLAQIAADAQDLEAGISLRSGLAADVTVRFETEAEAKALALLMDTATKSAAKGKRGQPSPFELANKVKFTTDGSVAKMSLRMTPEELEAAAVMAASQMKMQAQTAVKVRAMTSSMPNSSNAPAAPKKEEKKVIRIEGLDDGPRVIPYGQP